MVAHDQSKEINVAFALRPAATTDGTRNGSDINLAGYDTATVVIDAGLRTDGVHTPKLQEADDDGAGAAGAYTDVAAGDLVGAFVAVVTDTKQKVGYKGAKKWVRVAVVTTGATTGAVVGATILRGHAGKAPVA